MNKSGTIAAIATAVLLTAVVNPCKTPDKENPAPENKSTALTVKNITDETKKTLFDVFYIPGECTEGISSPQLTCNSGSKGSANGAIDTERLEETAEE